MDKYVNRRGEFAPFKKLSVYDQGLKTIATADTNPPFGLFKKLPNYSKIRK